MFNEGLNDYFVALVATVVTLNGVAIPLSYNIIADKLGPYLDAHIFKFFINEKIVKCNIITSIYSFIFFLIPLFFNFKVVQSDPLLMSITDYLKIFYYFLSVFFVAGFLISFYQFSYLIYEYAFNTEKIIFNKIKGIIDEYLK